jgi:hypothetical protein
MQMSAMLDKAAKLKVENLTGLNLEGGEAYDRSSD